MNFSLNKEYCQYLGEVGSSKFLVPSGKLKIENGEWVDGWMGSFKWKVKSGKCKMESGEWRIENRSASFSHYILALSFLL